MPLLGSDSSSSKSRRLGAPEAGAWLTCEKKVTNPGQVSMKPTARLAGRADRLDLFQRADPFHRALGIRASWDQFVLDSPLEGTEFEL
jgi:hypothetical protein